MFISSEVQESITCVHQIALNQRISIIHGRAAGQRITQTNDEEGLEKIRSMINSGDEIDRTSLCFSMVEKIFDIRSVQLDICFFATFRWLDVVFFKFFFL